MSNLDSIQRADELAKTGKYITVREIKKLLRAEGLRVAPINAAGTSTRLYQLIRDARRN